MNHALPTASHLDSGTDISNCRNSCAVVSGIRQEYLRDLALVADDEACFFAVMGELTRQRTEGRIA
jgi:hypothetical protein